MPRVVELGCWVTYWKIRVDRADYARVVERLASRLDQGLVGLTEAAAHQHEVGPRVSWLLARRLHLRPRKGALYAAVARTSFSSLTVSVRTASGSRMGPTPLWFCWLAPCWRRFWHHGVRSVIFELTLDHASAADIEDSFAKFHVTFWPGVATPSAKVSPERSSLLNWAPSASRARACARRGGRSPPPPLPRVHARALAMPRCASTRIAMR
jgi:hypothetical protein